MTKPTSMLTNFAAIPSRTAGDRNLTALHHAVLTAICRAVDPSTAQAVITHQRIATMTNRPRQKVVGAVADLAALGYITPINRGRQSHSTTPGRYLTNAYVIHYEGEVVEGKALPPRKKPDPKAPFRVTPGGTRDNAPETAAPCHPWGDSAHVTPGVRSRVTPGVVESDLYLSDRSIASDLQAAAAPRAAADAAKPSAQILPFKGSATRKSDDDDDGMGDAQETADRNHDANREILIGALQKRLGKSRREAQAMIDPLSRDRIDATAVKVRADHLTDDDLRASLADAGLKTWTDAKGRIRDYPPPEGWDPEWHGEWTGQREAPAPCPLPDLARRITQGSDLDLPGAAGHVSALVDFWGTEAVIAAVSDAGELSGIALLIAIYSSLKAVPMLPDARA
jgi:hypothetical protein